MLQERKVRPVGAHEESEVNTRVIAATNRDLASMVKDGSFREDLYYRISVIPMELPPLRERVETSPNWPSTSSKSIASRLAARMAISSPAMRLLENYSWPGNVRELEHTIERAVALETTDTIQPERLPEQITSYNPTRIASSFELAGRRH